MRYWISRIFLAALCLQTVALAAPVRELILNGGFESLSTTGGPESWGSRSWTDQALANMKLSTSAKSGKYALQVEGLSEPILYSAFSSPIILPEPTPLRLLLTLQYRTVGAPAPDVAVATFADDFTQREWNTQVLTSDALALEEAKDWQTRAWHVHLPPSARQAVVMLRVRGTGSLFVDNLSLKAHPAEVDLRVLEAGELTSSSGARTCRMMLTNRTDEPLRVKLQLEARPPLGGRATTAASMLNLAPGQPQEQQLGYSFRPDEAALVALTVTGPQEQLLERQVVSAAPLIDGRIVTPAFRGAILQALPTTELLAQGRLNATAELRGRLTLQGRLVGLSTDLPQVPVAPDGSWQVRTPLPGMLSGKYAVELRALEKGRQVAQTSLPFNKPEPKASETAYDARLRLWHNGQARLPLGVYYAVDESDLKAVAEAGFNMVVLPSSLASTALVQAAEKLGLTVLVSNATTDRDFWRTTYLKHGNTPALAGWYVLQRPEMQSPQVSPAAMFLLYEGLSSLDARHPVCLAVGSLSHLGDYAGACDILMPWTEPEPVGDLRSVEAMLWRAEEELADRKPMWPILQTTGMAYSQDTRLDPAGSGRPPTPAEYRCMAYLSLAHGATGLFSYAYRVPQARGQREYLLPREAPALWQMVRRVNQELRALTPVLLEGDPVSLRAERSVLPLRAWRYRDVYYVIAANPLAVPTAISFSVPGMKTNILEAAFEGGVLQGLGAGEFADQLPAQSARVYMGR